jgi:diguanylate cyclase (GGDEF)-like protein
MNIDALTLQVAAGAVVAITGICFILNTVLRDNARYGRLWSISFIAGILETISYLGWAVVPSAWPAIAVGNGALAVAISFLWVGSRVYNERTRSLVWIALVGPVVVFAATLVMGPDGGPWAGAGVMYLVIVVFAGLAAVESLRGHLLRTINGRVLAIVFIIVAGFYFLRMLVFFIAGEQSEAFLVYFGTSTTTFVAIALVIVAAIAMSVLQPASGTDSGREGRRAGAPDILGVSSLEHFDEQAHDWLARARRDRDPLVFLELGLENYEDIATTFGWGLADAAVTAVGRAACQNAPAAAIVGYLGDERFVVLTTAPAFGSAADIAGAIQTALVENPVDPTLGVRATASFGIATTEASGYELDALESAARAALDEARSDESGSVRTASSTGA